MVKWDKDPAIGTAAAWVAAVVRVQCLDQGLPHVARCGCRKINNQKRKLNVHVLLRFR